jgi:hypothetical protein
MNIQEVNNMTKPTKSYFFVNRKERWGLSLWGWIVILVLIVVPGILIMRNSYSMLAPVHREKTDVLVLEGFVSDYLMEEAIREFRTGKYSILITTGTPLELGSLLVSYGNTAALAAATLKKMGFDSTRLVSVATSNIQNDRTYNSALELKAWLQKNRPGTKAVNLMTMSVHGARSQKLFQYALGDSVKVGIISLNNFYYGPHTWWKNSKGFREVMNEVFGYFYVYWFFTPYQIKNPVK